MLAQGKRQHLAARRPGRLGGSRRRSSRSAASRSSIAVQHRRHEPRHVAADDDRETRDRVGDPPLEHGGEGRQRAPERLAVPDDRRRARRQPGGPSRSPGPRRSRSSAIGARRRRSSARGGARPSSSAASLSLPNRLDRPPARTIAVITPAPASGRGHPGMWPSGVRCRIPRRSRSSRIARTYFRLVPVASRNAAGVSGPDRARSRATAARRWYARVDQARSVPRRTIRPSATSARTPSGGQPAPAAAPSSDGGAGDVERRLEAIHRRDQLGREILRERGSRSASPRRARRPSLTRASSRRVISAVARSTYCRSIVASERRRRRSAARARGSGSPGLSGAARWCAATASRASASRAARTSPASASERNAEPRARRRRRPAVPHGARRARPDARLRSPASRASVSRGHPLRRHPAAGDAARRRRGRARGPRRSTAPWRRLAEHRPVPGKRGDRLGEGQRPRHRRGRGAAAGSRRPAPSRRAAAAQPPSRGGQRSGAPERGRATQLDQESIRRPKRGAGDQHVAASQALGRIPGDVERGPTAVVAMRATRRGPGPRARAPGRRRARASATSRRRSTRRAGCR